MSNLVGKYKTYHLDEGQPEVSKAEQIVFDILDSIRGESGGLRDEYYELGEDKQNELIEVLVKRTEKNLAHGIPKVCIIGAGVHRMTEVYHELGPDLVVLADRPPTEVMVLENLRIEDIQTELRQVVKQKPKKTFVMPHTKKRGNSWDGMQ